MFVRSGAAVLLFVALVLLLTSSGKSVERTTPPTSAATDGAGVIGSDSRDPQWLAQLKTLGAQKLARGWVVALAANYRPNAASFRPSSAVTIDSAARLLDEFTSARAIAEGHTDSQGSRALNKRLSRARAEAVCRYLQQKGVEASRLQAIGFADREPIASNTRASGRAKNRRVDLLFSDVNGSFGDFSGNAPASSLVRPNYGHRPLHRHPPLGGDKPRGAS